MHRRSIFVAALSITLFLVAVHSVAQPGEYYLKPGDIVPSLAAQALDGKWLDIPSDSHGKPAVVVFSFSRAGGRDAQQWTQKLTKDDPHLAVYNVIFLESVPGLFRGLAISAIKSGMPLELHGRTILLYADESLWKQRLKVANERNACVMLLAPTGRVAWMKSGPFADAFYLELSNSIRALN